MAKNKITQLREKYVNNFYFRNIDNGKYGLARVTEVKYFGNRYVIFFSVIYVDELGGTILLNIREDDISFKTFKSTFKLCNKKWAKGLLEYLVERIKKIGDGIINI